MFTNNMYMATQSGHFVNEAHQRIAEIIADYDPNLRLAFIPESERDRTNPDEKPFVVLDMGDGTREPYAVFFADECDEKLLARVFDNDLQRVDVKARLNAEVTAREAIRLRERMEREEYVQDITRTLSRRSFS